MSSEQELNAVTIGELVRTLQEFKREVREDFGLVNGRLDNLNMVHVDVYAADRSADSDARRSFDRRLENCEQECVRLRALAARGAGIATSLVAVAGVLGWSLHR